MNIRVRTNGEYLTAGRGALLLGALSVPLVSWALFHGHVPGILPAEGLTLLLFLTLTIGLTSFRHVCRRHRHLIRKQNLELAEARRTHRAEFDAYAATVDAQLKQYAAEVDRLEKASQIAEQTLRDAESASRDLKAEKARAQSALQAKEVFLSSVSHELRTPMNAIIGLTHVLTEESPRPDQRHHLEVLQFSAQNLLALINDVLDYSKIEAGKLTLERSPFDPRELLTRTLASFQPLASDKGIALRLLLDADLPPALLGDSTRLSQILNNLVSNAVKFTAVGEVTIAADVAPAAPGSEEIHLTLSVSDTGIGIEADQLDTIFEDFTQASEDTARRFGGTGLGLSITRRLVEMQHGTLQVTSDLGIGSVFSVTLPFPIAEAIPEPVETVAGTKVLLVEDNAVNQQVATRLLEKWDIAVTIAENGHRALALCEERTFDLILMDIQMPGIDGYETTARLRHREGATGQRTPIIALTASVGSNPANRMTAAGLDGWLTKPFNPEELRQIVARFALV